MEIVGVWFISAADIAAIWQGPEQSGAKAPALRGLFKFARVSAAERHFPRSGLGRSFSRGAASPAGRGYGLGGAGGVSPRGTVRVFVVFEPDTGLD